MKWAIVVTTLLAGTACADPDTAPASRTTPNVESSTATSREPSNPDHFPLARSCPEYIVRELPDGSEAGAGRPLPAPGEPALQEFMTEWGERDSSVVIGRGQEVLDHWGELDRTSFPPRGGWTTVIGPDGTERHVIPLEEPPAGQVSYHFLSRGCPYIAWTEPGLDMAQAVAFAARF